MTELAHAVSMLCFDIVKFVRSLFETHPCTVADPAVFSIDDDECNELPVDEYDEVHHDHRF
jgi:hypothetical protein